MLGLTKDDKSAVGIYDIKISGVEFLRLLQLEISHDADKIKISAVVNKKAKVLFQGYISNFSL